MGTQWSLTLLLRLSNSSSQYHHFEGTMWTDIPDSPPFSRGPSPLNAISLKVKERANKGIRQNEIKIFLEGVQFEEVCNHTLLRLIA